MDRTLILLKPDTLERGLMGDVISRFERKGLTIVGLKMMNMTEEMARQHYHEHVDRPFFPSLKEFMTSHPIVALAIEGVGSVEICRKMTGATFGMKAEPGTIRGDYGISTGCNLIHSSENKEAAARELQIFFQENEVFSYEPAVRKWVVTQEDIDKAK